MDNNQATTFECAVCKEATESFCPNCATGVDVHGITRTIYYCGKACQTTDWAAGHKLECKFAIDRRQLFRIGSIMQEAFYQSSKAIWFHDVTRVKKIEHAERGDDPRLLVWRGNGQGGVDVPAFLVDLVKEERDERAMLASAISAVAIMDSLLGDFIKAAKCHITLEEVGVRPMASRYVRFVPQAATVLSSGSICRMFRATLRNGQMFAVDLCNAQYNFTTRAEHRRGMFEWDSYMKRLLIADRTAIDVQPLVFNVIRASSSPISGNLADGQAGTFVEADIKCTAEIKARSTLMTMGTILGARRMPSTIPEQMCDTTLPKLMSRSSTDHEHAKEVVGFLKQLQQMIGLSQILGIKQTLIIRLRATSS